MNTTLLKVFVYGTLKPGESYFQKYGLDRFSQAEKATAIGSLYHLPRYHYPAMGKGNNTVWGYVLQISHPRVLNELDYLEGYIKGIIPTGNSYNRTRIQTFRPSGQPLTIAWVYQMQLEQIKSLGGIPIPSGDWR